MSLKILVAGMHRSGTSAVAAAIDDLGLPVGPEELVMPEADSNPRGHFELLPVVNLNDRLLSACGAHWAGPRGLTPEALVQMAGEDLGREARDLLDNQLVGVAWLKDPRFCLTAPFWQAVVGDEPLAIVIPWRDPREVAQSLRTRNNISLEYGMRLWELYNRHALDFARNRPHHILSYAHLLADPEIVLKELAAFLKEFVPETEANVSDAIDAVDHTLRHALIVEPTTFSEEVQAIIDVLESGEPQSISPRDPVYEDELFGAGEMFGRAHDRAAGLEAEQIRIMFELESATARLDELDGRYRQVQLERDELLAQHHSASFRGETGLSREVDPTVRLGGLVDAELSGRLEDEYSALLAAELATAFASTLRLDIELASAIDERERIRTALAQVESDRDRLEGEAAAAHESAQSLRSTVEAQATTIQDLRAELASTTEHRDVLRAELEFAKTELSRLGEELCSEQERTAGIEAEVVASRMLVAELQALVQAGLASADVAPPLPRVRASGAEDDGTAARVAHAVADLQTAARQRHLALRTAEMRAKSLSRQLARKDRELRELHGVFKTSRLLRSVDLLWRVRARFRRATRA